MVTDEASLTTQTGYRWSKSRLGPRFMANILPAMPLVFMHKPLSPMCGATVGGTSIENTHPFHHGKWIFAHNGTVPNFDRLRPVILDHMDPLHRTEIMGTTDSEHVFRYLMSLSLRHPERGLKKKVRLGLAQIIIWSIEIDPQARIGLNIVLTDGEHVVGSR